MKNKTEWTCQRRGSKYEEIWKIEIKLVGQTDHCVL